MSHPHSVLSHASSSPCFARPFSFANAWKYSGSLPVLALMLSMYALYVIVFATCICQDDLNSYCFFLNSIGRHSKKSVGRMCYQLWEKFGLLRSPHAAAFL